MSDPLKCHNCSGAMTLRPNGSPNGYPSASCPDCGTVVMFRTKKAAEAIRARFFATAPADPAPTQAQESPTREEAVPPSPKRAPWWSLEGL